LTRDRHSDVDYAGPVRRIVFGILVILLTALFLLWRIDSPRVERFRAALIDRFIPGFEWALVPVTRIAGMIDSFQSYTSLYSQNQELRRELQQMKSWKEAALQLEQQNAKLLAQNQVRLDPKLTSVSGVVLADSGSPFRQSVIMNVGARDGIVDGWATMDGLGLVGRISGVGQLTSRVLLLTDASSRIPVTIQPSGQRAMLVGDNSPAPPLEFIEDPKLVRPGDRVVSSGDGGVFPAGLLVGQVAMDRESRLRVLLAADYERLDFLRVLRSHPAEQITEPGKLIPPPGPEARPSLQFGAPGSDDEAPTPPDTPDAITPGPTDPGEPAAVGNGTGDAAGSGVGQSPSAAEAVPND
jgi:rod shape-determining protein MreC